MMKLITPLAMLSALAGCSCASNDAKTAETKTDSKKAVVATIAGHAAPAGSRPHGARLEEFKQDGKAIGFKLGDVEEGSDWSRHGLKNGDVVVAVNGDPVEVSNGPAGLWSYVQSGDATTFEILRPDPKTGKLARRTLGAK